MGMSNSVSEIVAGSILTGKLKLPETSYNLSGPEPTPTAGSIFESQVTRGMRCTGSNVGSF